MTVSDLDMRHQMIAAGSVRFHCAEAGEGIPTLLIPGWPQTGHAWRKVVPLLIAAGRRVIVYEPRGMGGSDVASEGYDLDTAATDLHTVLETLGLAGDRTLDVVSHDLGSWVAFAHAHAYPDDVRRLVLSEVTIPRPGVGRPIPDEIANIKTWHFGFNRLASLPEALIGGRERLFLDWLFDAKSRRPDAIDGQARITYAEAFAAPGAATAGFDYYRALFSGPGLARMSERLATPLPMPVLAIGTDGGVGNLLAESLRGAAEDLHDVLIADCGHYLPEESPEAFVETLMLFWDDGDRR